MKRLGFLLVLFIACMFTGCTKKVYIDVQTGKEVYVPTKVKIDVEDIIDVELVASKALSGDIYRDKHTDVLYYDNFGGVTPIMEADGTCLTWAEFTKRKANLNE